MTDPDVHGPVDVAVFEFHPDEHGDASADAVADLIDRGVLRPFDVLVLRKDEDGRCAEIDLGHEDAPLTGWSRFAEARSGLLRADDVRLAGTVLECDTVGVVLLYENRWAVPLVSAVHREGAELVATTRLTAEEILDALDSAEASG